MGCTESFPDRICDQEMFVSGKFYDVKQQLRGYGYTDSQIKGKLRQEYYGNVGNNDFIMNHRWEDVKL